MVNVVFSKAYGQPGYSYSMSQEASRIELIGPPPFACSTKQAFIPSRAVVFPGKGSHPQMLRGRRRKKEIVDFLLVTRTSRGLQAALNPIWISSYRVSYPRSTCQALNHVQALVVCGWKYVHLENVGFR